MQIEHIALWTNQLEQLKYFYQIYFQANVGDKYHNPAQQFESYFLSFSTGARLELMYKPGRLDTRTDQDGQFNGYTHISFAVGSEQNVDELNYRL